MKKIVSFIICVMLMLCSFSVLTGCGDKKVETSVIPDGAKVLKIGVAKQSDELDLAWRNVAKDFENIYKDKGYYIEILSANNIEQGVKPMFTVGNAPDIMFLPTGRTAGLTEELVKDRSLLNLKDILDKKVYGEDVTLKEKFIKGFLDTVATNPYQDSLIPDTDTYMLPMFSEPYGFFYNKDLFNERGIDNKYKMPKSYDAFLNLRNKLNDYNEANVAAGGNLPYRYLLGYGKAEKLKALATPTFATFAGQKLEEKMLVYDYVFENASVSRAAKKMKDINMSPDKGGDTGNFVHKPSMTGEASVEEIQNDFLKNEILFVPGGLDFKDEMSSNGLFNDFNLGFTACPSASDSAQQYVYTDFQQIYVLKHTKEVEMAHDFLLYLFSDRSAKLFSSIAGKVLPTNNALKIASENSFIDEFTSLVYSVYNDGARPICGEFKNVVQKGDEVIDWDNFIITNISQMFKGAETDTSYLSKLKDNSIKMRLALLEQ